MFDDFLSNKNSWHNTEGPLSRIIFSSRLRLARNLADVPFPWKATTAQKEAICKKIEENYRKIPILKDSFFVRMEDVAELDREFLLERHLLSREFLTSLKGKALIVSSDERISIMINEEDHFRIQFITAGFELKKCWQILNEIDTQLSKIFSFAFDQQIGYLTACPTNVGTALRTSCMLHIPALVLTKRINKMLEFMAKISFTARGFFGEGTQALGNFFQISNQGSLGFSEEELIENISSVVNQIKDQELEARDILLKKHRISLEDNVWRAFGMLRHARLMNSKEALAHLSMLSLGIDLDIIKNLERQTINELFTIIQPAHLQKIENKILKEEERDYIRAKILREKLS
ncbi:MAG: protein arginine kinase [Candidatus Omnitrophica bacterium]|nr:protein arginine kinase [Candidatus Omnitrophota bacterium]